MNCTVCGGENARIYYKTPEGKNVKMILCSQCYRRLYEDPERALFALVGREDQRVCPACGATFSDYKRTGLVGCAECYAFFREELLPAIRYVQHNNYHHAGKAPSGIADEKYDRVRFLVEEQARLRAQIDSARAAGHEEEAVRLTELLTMVNKELYGGES